MKKEVTGSVESDMERNELSSAPIQTEDMDVLDQETLYEQIPSPLYVSFRHCYKGQRRTLRPTPDRRSIKDRCRLP